MKNLMKSLSVLLVGVLCLQFSGCGTILYPERRNQSSGKVDVAVALMDGFWLLVGIIPGVIAFAVDFSTGAIYLPHGIVKGEKENYKIVHFDPKHTTKKELEKLISYETGQDFTFENNQYEMNKVDNKEEGLAKLSGVN